MNFGEVISAEDAEARQLLHELTQEANRITLKLNNEYHPPEEVREILAELTGREIDDDVVVSPPFHTDCGKNLQIGRHVFINRGCFFQDHGGITIGDNVMIGHGVTMVTVNHGRTPETRENMYLEPIRIGDGAIIYSGAIIGPGVTIGENAIIAAGAVVTKDVEANTTVAGVPARKLERR